MILLLYRVGDCVVHLCPICNRRTRNVLDDDDDDDDIFFKNNRIQFYTASPTIVI